MAKPDCVHCAFMQHQKSSEYRCLQHNITLHSPVSIFCKNITPKVDNETYQKWFDEALTLDDLASSVLYTWVVTQIVNQQGLIETQVDSTVVADVGTYIDWPAGVFWKMLRDIRQKQQDDYRKSGNRLVK